jgi:hypothetical protein
VFALLLNNYIEVVNKMTTIVPLSDGCTE